MQVSLRFIGHEPDNLRWFIRADEQHAGGITVHSVCPPRFSYGIAVSPTLRRQGIALQAVPLLLSEMRRRGMTVCIAEIAPDNAASLALHRHLGFREDVWSDNAVRFIKDL